MATGAAYVQHGAANSRDSSSSMESYVPGFGPLTFTSALAGLATINGATNDSHVHSG